jgi:Core-2/I-Branching enzyme
MPRFRILYGILSNDPPPQISNLLELLLDGENFAVVHQDKKAATLGSGGFGDGFETIRGMCVNWGGFSMIEATMLILKRAIRYDFDYFALQSATTVPLTSQRLIIETLESKASDLFIESSAFPNKQWGGGTHRYEGYHFNDWFGSLGRASSYARAASRRIARSALETKTPPPDLTMKWGSQWWIAKKHVCQSLVSIWDREPTLRSFFRYSHVPDEMFFQTVVASRLLNIKVCPTNFLWIRRKNGGRPEYLRAADLDRINRDKYLFARKVNLEERNDELRI